MEHRSVEINTVNTSYSSERNYADTNGKHDVTYRFILLEYDARLYSALFLECRMDY